MNAFAVVRFVAVFATGLLAGIFLGDRMGASFARPALSPSSFVKFQQIQHVHFVKMMPIFMGIAILSSITWLILLRSRAGSWASPSSPWRRLRTFPLVCSRELSTYPINDLLMTWNASSPPANVMEIWARWEQVHTLRTCLAVWGLRLSLWRSARHTEQPGR